MACSQALAEKQSIGQVIPLEGGAQTLAACRFAAQWTV